MSEPLRTWPVITLPIKPRPKRTQHTHHPQCFQAHVAKVIGAAISLVEPGKELDLLADLGVGGEIFWLDALPAQTAWRPCVWR